MNRSHNQIRRIISPYLLCGIVAVVFYGCNSSEDTVDDEWTPDVKRPLVEYPHKPYGRQDHYDPYDDMREPYNVPYYTPTDRVVSTLERVGAKLALVTSNPMEAWEYIGGQDLISSIRNNKNEFKPYGGLSSTEESLFEKVVNALFVASELTAMEDSSFQLEEKEFLCDQLSHVDFRNELSKSIATRLFNRGDRFDATDYVSLNWPALELTVAARHPLANVAKFCDIPENDFDLKFAILNHKIGRLIKTISAAHYLNMEEKYSVKSSTNLDINKTLTEFVKMGNVIWLHGPSGNPGQVRDWFSNIFAKMLRSESGFFEVGGDGIYRLCVTDVDAKSDLYKGIGMVLASALIEGYSLGVEFNRVFYEVLLHKLDVTKLNRKDLELNDRQFFNSWKYGADCDTEDGVRCEEAIEDAFEDTNMVSSDGKRELVENGRNIPITVDNIKQYSKLLLVDYLYDRHAPQYELISAGLDEMLPRDIFDFVSVENLKEFLRGKTDLSAKELKESINWPYSGQYAVGNQGYLWLNELFETDGTEGQKFRNDFIKFATSLTTPPLGGFVENSNGNGKIRVLPGRTVGKDWDNRERVPRPTSYTCHFQICIPEYGSKLDLGKYLKEAFQNGSFAYDDVEAELLQDN